MAGTDANRHMSDSDDFDSVPYSQMTNGEQENFNFHDLALRLARAGFVAQRLHDDSRGADLIARRQGDGRTLAIQQKGRLTFDEKYQNKQLYEAFPTSPIGDRDWYVAPYDLLETLACERGVVFDTKDWRKKEYYSYSSAPQWILTKLEKYRLPNLNISTPDTTT